MASVYEAEASLQSVQLRFQILAVSRPIPHQPFSWCFLLGVGGKKECSGEVIKAIYNLIDK